MLYRIVWQAQRGGEKFEIAQQDALSTAEAIFPSIADAVSMKAASSDYTRSLLRRTKTITMNDGEGAVPDDALTRYACDATLLDPSNTVKRYSFMEFNRFVAERTTSLLGRFTILGELRLLQREPGALYVAGEGFSDDMELTIPCEIVTPTTEDEEVDVVPELNAELVNVGALMLRGEIASKAAMVS